jgi:hypothetical protein
MKGIEVLNNFFEGKAQKMSPDQLFPGLGLTEDQLGIGEEGSSAEFRDEHESNENIESDIVEKDSDNPEMGTWVPDAVIA